MFLRSLLFHSFLSAALLMWSCGTSMAGQVLNIDAGRYDLLRAHSERIVVVFGGTVAFHRYRVVEVLNQTFAVASDVPGGVRFHRRSGGGEEMLLIE